jgi:hypothetical protein
VTPARDARGGALLVVLLLTVASSLAGLLLFLRIVQRRADGSGARAAAAAAAESGLKSVVERVRRDAGPELVRAAGFSLESEERPLYYLQLESRTVVEVARPRFAGTSRQGGSNLDRVNQSGFVTETWRIASSVRSGRTGEEARLQADLILGPVPIDISRLPEPD